MSLAPVVARYAVTRGLASPPFNGNRQAATRLAHMPMDAHVRYPTRDIRENGWANRAEYKNVQANKIARGFKWEADRRMDDHIRTTDPIVTLAHWMDFFIMRPINGSPEKGDPKTSTASLLDFECTRYGKHGWNYPIWRVPMADASAVQDQAWPGIRRA